MKSGFVVYYLYRGLNVCWYSLSLTYSLIDELCILAMSTLSIALVLSMLPSLLQYEEHEFICSIRISMMIIIMNNMIHYRWDDVEAYLSPIKILYPSLVNQVGWIYLFTNIDPCTTITSQNSCRLAIFS